MRPILISPGFPHEKEYRVYAGDTFQAEIVGYNEDGTPKDFTGFTFLMQVRVDETDVSPTVDITNTSFTITADAAGTLAGVSNVVTINHTKDDFVIGNAGKYVYDIQATDTNSNVQTIQVGDFYILEDASR